MYNLVTTITNLPSMVGCQDFPNTPQGMNLIKLINDFINQEYGYSGEVVKKAFMMAAKQELYLDGKRVDSSTFGQHLSVNVVGRVLTAYKESIRANNARPQGYNPLQLPPANVNKLTPQEAHELILKWCNEDGELPKIAPYETAFRYLLEKKQVTEPVEEMKKRRSVAILGNSMKMEVSQRRLLAESWYKNNVLK